MGLWPCGLASTVAVSTGARSVMALRCAAGGAYLTREEADAAASALGDPHPPPRGTRAHLPPVGPVLTILQGSMGVALLS